VDGIEELRRAMQSQQDGIPRLRIGITVSDAADQLADNIN
jgi:hypothetical protein